MKRPYPLDIQRQRTLPEGYDGPVLVWDIDKTYLATSFSSLRGLVRIPLESALDKRAIPGMPEVLRGLRWGPGPAYACVPLLFLSASPAFLRSVLQRRMTMDGVEYDGMVLKDWGQVLRQLRPRRLQEQVPFKLCALLTGRLGHPQAVEYLFGDDVEQDALAYSLYAGLLSGEISAGEGETAMKKAGLRREDRRLVRTLLDQVPQPRGSVGRIFIHLARGSAPALFSVHGPRVVAVRSAYQMALALQAEGLLGGDWVLRTREAALRAGQDVDDLLEDARARGIGG